MSSPSVKNIILLFALFFIHSNVFAYEEENKVICAITSKIAKFTQKNNSDINPYTITVLNNQFGDLCTDMYKDTKINNKDVQVLYFDDIHNLKQTNILFIFDTPIDQLDEILSYIKNKHILTISTMRGFAQRGGMVQIYSQNQKLKLKINLDSVKQEKIYIHSALLRIANIIRGDRND
ncbi:MAG: YfiR family protein [Pseudomonadota bacterium]